MFEPFTSWGPHRHRRPRVQHSRSSKPGRLALALVLGGFFWLPHAPQALRASPSSLAAPVFPGPTAGSPATATPTPHDFSYSCTTGSTTAPVQVGGIALAAGDAIQSQGCGAATLLLNAPAASTFQADIAIAPGAAPSGTASLEVLVLGAGGFNLHTGYARATAGRVAHLAADASGGVAVTLMFLTPTPAVLYHVRLSGDGRALRPVPLGGTGMPAGATPVPAGAIATAAFAAPAGAPATVSGVQVPAAGTYQLGGGGKITIHLPPSAGATLAVRVGTDETQSPYTTIPTQLSLAVLDDRGHLLRKATALTYVGGGLQALWVATRGGGTVTLTDDVGPHVVVTGFSLLAATYAPHPNPDHEDFGSPGGGAVDVSPDAMIATGNAVIGMEQGSVAHQPVAPDSYMVLGGGGTGTLVLTNARGRFSARFGALDSGGAPGQPHAATLVALDQNSHPLETVHVTAKAGAPGTMLSASITGASLVVVQASGGPNAALYDMTLSGHATLYDRIFPPSEPPVSTAGGVPVDPGLFTLAWNVHVVPQDTLLLHQAALEQWSLDADGAGAATAHIAALPGSHTLFSILYGLTVADQHFGIGHLRLSVLNAGGKALRTVGGVARAGYGAQRLAVSLAGGATLQIGWEDVPLTVFALTAS